VTDLLDACQREDHALKAFLRDLVLAESPSHDRPALDRCAEVVLRRFESDGALVGRRHAGTTADHIVATWPGQGTRVLLMGHLDTVWPVGQLQRQPLEERDGKLFGPGVYDMKAGLAIGATAVRVLQNRRALEDRPAVTFLVTSDEEVGSGTSRKLIEDLARQHDAVLVLEPAIPGGAVKTARKGVGEFQIVLRGVSSHAGADPDAGASAIHELARQILALEALADPANGLTVNVGVIDGGSRSNVVAEEARALVDVRVSRPGDASRVETAIRALRATHPRVTMQISGSVKRPPMERSAGVVALFEMARAVAAENGWTLREGSTGGASDGNFTAALGVPTLDGLGALGDGPHALHEHVVINELAPRAALLAGLILRLGDNGSGTSPRRP